jgi:hypothetical protein
MLKSWKVRLAATSAVALVVLAAGLVWLWAERAALAERVIGRALAERGIAPISFNVGFIGLRSISLSGIVIGDPAAPDAAASSVTIAYSLGELLSGEVRSVEVEEAQLHVTLTREGLSLGALDPLLAGEGGGGLVLPPIAVRDAALTVTTPYGEFAFAGPASVQPEGEAILVSSRALRIADVADEPRFVPLVADGHLRLEGKRLGFTASVASAVDEDVPVPLFEAEGIYDGETRAGRATAEGALVFAREGLAPAAIAPVLRSLYLDIGGGIDYRAVVDVSGGEVSVAAVADLTNFSLNQTAGGSFAFTGKVEATGGLDEGTLKPIRMDLRGVKVADLALSERFAPLRVEGPVKYAQGALSADFVLRSALPPIAGARLANVTASYDVPAGRGQVRANGDLAFTPGQLELQTLLPSLKGTVARMSGALSYSANASLKDGNFMSSGVAKLSKVGFTASAATVEGVSGTVSLSSLLPLRTKGIQTLKVGMLQTGVPLENGMVAFELGRAGLRIVDANWPFAEGKLVLVSSSASVTAGNAEFLLSVEDVDLSVLTDLAGIPGLKATGRINGQVPIAIRNGDPILLDGNISAKDSGVIVYRGETTEAVASEQTKLLTDALQNFHYTELAGGLSGNANGELVLRLSLKGANPDLYDGYPFAINVKLEGSLADLLRRGTVGFRPLELIKEQSKGAVQPPANRTEP